MNNVIERLLEISGPADFEDDAKEAAKEIVILRCALVKIAKGRSDNGRPLPAETTRQIARRTLIDIGLDWPVRRDDS